ncbi:MAG: glycosyltransferase [Nanoarchaeota archaeon]|nr:MAG: glycosyltransferase [Nanoarchaeota archaeon]
MKILMTTSFYPPYHVGGADTLVKYFAEQLAKEGHEVHVLFSLDAFRLKRPYAKKKEDYNGVKVHALESPIGKLEPVLNYTLGTQSDTQSYFDRLVEKEKFDVVHHHNISLLGPWVLEKKGNYRNVYTAHDFWLVCPKYDLYKFGKICETKICIACVPLHGKPYPFYQTLPKFKNTVNKEVDILLAPSNYMKGRINREYEKKVSVIPNFVPEPPKNLPSVDEKDYFLFVGQLERHKGILQLVETFKGTGKKLLILGKGSLETQLRKKLTDEKINNVFYKGWASSPKEVLSLMKNANAIIIPSLWAENNPMVALEALSVGTPVIGTKNGGIPDIVEKIDSSLLFDSDDFSHLKKIIAGFSKKKYSASKLKSIFRENYSWKAHSRMLRSAGYYG